MRTVTMAQARQMARDQYEDQDECNVEVDLAPNANEFSQTPDGCWVRAWVYVPDITVETPPATPPRATQAWATPAGLFVATEPEAKGGAK